MDGPWTGHGRAMDGPWTDSGLVLEKPQKKCLALRANTKLFFVLALRASSKYLFIPEIINLAVNLQLFNEALKKMSAATRLF